MKHVSTSRKSETDIKRLKSMKEPDIVIDNDAPAWTPEMFARAIVRKGWSQCPGNLCYRCGSTPMYLSGSALRVADISHA